MTVYRGVVKGDTVVLSGPVDLPDGAEVEVRPVALPLTAEEERVREEEFQQSLVQRGLLTRIRRPQPDPPGTDRTPVPILSGPPVSQTIIEERR